MVSTEGVLYKIADEFAPKNYDSAIKNPINNKLTNTNQQSSLMISTEGVSHKIADEYTPKNYNTA